MVKIVEKGQSCYMRLRNFFKGYIKYGITYHTIKQIIDRLTKVEKLKQKNLKS